MLGRPSPGFTFGAPAKDDVIIVEAKEKRLRTRVAKKPEQTSPRDMESQESLTFSFGATRLNSDAKTAAKTNAKMSERHQITISGLLVEDPKTRHVVNVQKTVFVYNAEDDGQAAMVEEAVETLTEECKLLETHFFGTKIEVPKDFLPTAVGGLTESFKITTIAKMVREEAKKQKACKKRRVSPAAK